VERAAVAHGDAPAAGAVVFLHHAARDLCMLNWLGYIVR
jgi:hypothetical protein